MRYSDSDIIILSDSDEDSDASVEYENPKSRAQLSKSLPKKTKKSKPIMHEESVLTLDEQYLLADDESEEEDDDAYEDTDAMYNGTRSRTGQRSRSKHTLRSRQRAREQARQNAIYRKEKERKIRQQREIDRRKQQIEEERVDARRKRKRHEQQARYEGDSEEETEDDDDSDEERQRVVKMRKRAEESRREAEIALAKAEALEAEFLRKKMEKKKKKAAEAAASASRERNMMKKNAVENTVHKLKWKPNGSVMMPHKLQPFAARKSSASRYRSEEEEDEESDEEKIERRVNGKRSRVVFAEEEYDEPHRMAQPKLKTKAQPSIKPRLSTSTVRCYPSEDRTVSTFTTTNARSYPSERRQRVDLCEKLSIQELQAQERELARLKAIQKRREEKPKRSSSTNQSRRMSTKDIESEPSDASKTTSAKVKVVPILRPSTPAKTQRVVPSVPPPSSSAITMTHSAAVQTSQAFAIREGVQPIPIMDSSSWRRLSSAQAPLLFLPTSSLSTSTWSLEAFDETKTLSTRAQLVESTSDTVLSQEETTLQVEQVIQTVFPMLQACHQQRTQAIFKANRQQIQQYQTQTPCWQTSQDIVVYFRQHLGSLSSTRITPIERIYLARMRDHLRATNPIPNRLVGTIRYTIGTLDNVETIHVPNTVIEFGSALLPLRRSCSLITVKTNQPVEDQPILRYVPYFGITSRISIDPKRYEATTMDKTKRFRIDHIESKEEIEMEINQLETQTITCRMEDEMIEYLVRIIVYQCGRQARVFQAISSLLSIENPQVKYQQVCRREQQQSIVRQRLQSIQQMNSQDIRNGYFKRLLSSSTCSDPLGFSSTLDSHYLQNQNSKGLRTTQQMETLQEWYRFLFCSRCYTYDCCHGIQPLSTSSRRRDPINPVIQYSRMNTTQSIIALSSDSSSCDEQMLQEEEEEEDEAMRRSQRSNTRACSLATANLQIQEQWMEKRRKQQAKRQEKRLLRLVQEENEYLDPYYKIYLQSWKDKGCKRDCYQQIKTIPNSMKTSVDWILIDKIASIVGHESCLIAHILQSHLTCAQIHTHLKSITYSQPSLPRIETKRTTRIHLDANQGLARYFQPCNHQGPCIDCDCIQRQHYCERSCTCSRTCSNRFQGCTCTLPGQCRTKACPCRAADRECDPDYCFSCRACEVAVLNPQEKRTCEVLGICTNVNLLRGLIKKIGVAFSATHGWGAFALVPIHKDEFVYEYTGALIHDDEAERRGNIYDAMMISYLFDVNEQQVVDAYRMGNKIKFANHRLQTHANLKTTILNVRGEHRIALIATKEITIGEELFFDYGYHNQTAPEWSQELTPHHRYHETSDSEEELLE